VDATEHADGSAVHHPKPSLFYRVRVNLAADRRGEASSR
jgi:hypothetical protein